LPTFSASLFGIDASPGWRWLAALSGALGLVGVLDLCQRKSTL
jgi:hypothetical protein